VIFKNRNILPRWAIFIIDTCIVIACFWLAYLLRFNFKIPSLELELIPRGLIFLISVRVIGFFIMRTYAGMIAYTSSEDAQRIFITITLGTLFSGIINFITHSVFSIPYLIPFSILLIDYLAEMVFLMGYRVGVKIIYLELLQSSKEKINVIIHGATEAGTITKRSLERDRKKNYNIVAFTDTRSAVFKQNLEGIKVYDVKNNLKNLLEKNEINQMIIAVWEIPASLKKFIIEECLKYHVRVLHVPPAQKWINGEINNNQIREVKIEELLERDPIQLNLEEIKSQVFNKIILVTGAAGSIGSEIVRQLAVFNPKIIILLDQAETPLYELDLDLKKNFPFINYEIVIGDVRVKERMENVFKTFKPQLVYHAAAYKHVPLMEDNPSESILTNVWGSKVCADLAVEYEVEKFVLVSTDKAVNPTNVMGASKRIAEMYVQSFHKYLDGLHSNHTKFITTRFGNVLGSNGSVIPLFRKQIESGGPLTVTHPEVTRFFMTIPEACQLVLEAGAMGKGGEIFIFDMGEPVLIVDLARKMIELSGFEVDEDIKIQFTGLRPGEKLYEELLNNNENTRPTHHPKIMIASVREYEYDLVSQQIESLVSLFDLQNNNNIVKNMKQMVPEFISNNSVYESLDK
jgi:FlaA1/EpsC-like NDP-sugar epimerase